MIDQQSASSYDKSKKDAHKSDKQIILLKYKRLGGELYFPTSERCWWRASRHLGIYFIISVKLLCNVVVSR